MLFSGCLVKFGVSVRIFFAAVVFAELSFPIGLAFFWR